MTVSPPHSTRRRVTARATRRGLAALSVTALGVGVLTTAATGAGAATGRISFPSSVPSFATAHNAIAPAAVAGKMVQGEVFLPLQDEAGAQALATAVSDPTSPQYGQYVSPSAWISEYAPTQADFQSVAQYLKTEGATIYAKPASREYIVFRMRASALPTAFGTSLSTYHVQGKTVTAPRSAPSLPASVGGKVSAVLLGDSRAMLTRPTAVGQGTGTNTTEQARPGVKPASSTTCSSYWDENELAMPTAYGKSSFPTEICGYLPNQLRSAGGLDKQIYSGEDGSGQTVAIVDAYASPTIVSDTNRYMSQVGSPLLSDYSQIVPKLSRFDLRGACQQPAGWQTEQTLDVQSAHSVAPGAHILYSGGFDCSGGIDIAVSKILDGGLANVVSNSYSYGPESLVPGGFIAGQLNIEMQAAAEGIGMYYSSGDDGDNQVLTGYPSPSFFVSSPWVTGVGGTSEAISADGSYDFETGWGDILDQVVDNAYSAPLPGNLYGGGAGGGVSSLFNEPYYQKGVVPDALATKVSDTPSRVTPDISDLADPYTGFTIGYSPITDQRTLKTGSFGYVTYGGTSLASPITAAKMAMVQAATGRTIGFANPLLYASDTAHPNSFHDVKSPASPLALAYLSGRSGNLYLNTLDKGLSLSTKKGYDDITGIGSLDVPNLAAYLSGS